MPNAGFSVVITAQDKASAHIDALNRRIKAMSAPAERTRKAFDQLAQSTGLRDVGREFRDLSHSSGRFLADISRAAPLLSSVGAALSVAGAADLANRFASVGSNLFLTARQAGVTVPHLQRLGYAASMAGGNAENAQSAVAGLNKNLQLLQHTGQGSAEFMNALTVLGVQQNSVMGKKTGDVLETLLKKLAALHNPVEQTTLAKQLGLEAFIPLIIQGTRALQNYLNVAKRMPTLTKAQAHLALALQSSMRRLSLDVETTAMAIMGQFAPAGTNAAAAIANWIEKNHALIEADVGNFVRRASKDVEAFAGHVNVVVQDLGGWNTVLHAVFDLMAARFALTFLTPFAKAAIGVAKVTRALYAMRAAAVAATVAEGVATAGGAGVAAAGAGAAAGAVGLGAVALGTLGLGVPLLAMAWGASQAPPMANKQERERAHALMRYIEKQGKTKAFAAGMVGNAWQESDLNPSAGHLGPHGHYGIYQLGYAEQQRYAKWASMTGHHALLGSSATDQTAFALWELDHGDSLSRQAGRVMATVPNTTAGAGVESDAFMVGFERPGNYSVEHERRAARAETLFNQPDTAPTVVHTVKGQATVNVNIAGAPPGSRVSALAAGDMFIGAPRVTMPMPAAGGPN